VRQKFVDLLAISVQWKLFFSCNQFVVAWNESSAFSHVFCQCRLARRISYDFILTKKYTFFVKVENTIFDCCSLSPKWCDNLCGNRGNLNKVDFFLNVFSYMLYQFRLVCWFTCYICPMTTFFFLQSMSVQSLFCPVFFCTYYIS